MCVCVCVSCPCSPTATRCEVRLGRTIQECVGHTNVVTALAITPALIRIQPHTAAREEVFIRVLYAASADHATLAFDLRTGAILQTLRGHTLSVMQVKYSASGDMPSGTVVTASFDRQILVFSALRGVLLRSVSCEHLIHDVVLLGPTIAAVLHTGALVFHSLHTLALLALTPLCRPARNITCAAVCPVTSCGMQVGQCVQRRAREQRTRGRGCTPEE